MNPRAYVEGLVKDWAPSFKVAIQPEVALPDENGAYHFTTVWSKPTKEEPVPKAVARVQLRVWMDEGRLTHDYTLESHSFVRSAAMPFREAWLHELLKNKHAIQRRMRYISDDAAKLSDDEDEDDDDGDRNHNGGRDLDSNRNQSRSGANAHSAGSLQVQPTPMNRRSPSSTQMAVNALSTNPESPRGATHDQTPLNTQEKEFVTRVRRSDTMARGVGGKNSPKDLLRNRRGR